MRWLVGVCLYSRGEMGVHKMMKQTTYVLNYIARWVDSKIVGATYWEETNEQHGKH